jgi:hypothetical protein
MSIKIQTGANQAAYAFNETRLNKILHATTLNEAQRMGFLDRITDRFRGNVKQRAIRELFESVTRPAPHESKPVDMLTRFRRLRDLALSDHQNQFTTNFSRPDENGAWGYSLSIDNTCIYSSPPEMLDQPHTSFAEFYGVARADHMRQQSNLFAARCQEQSKEIVSGGGYIDIEKFESLRNEFKDALKAFDPNAQETDVMDDMLELAHTHPVIAEQVFESLRRIELGSTNLLQALYGDRAPKPVSLALGRILDNIVTPGEDVLALTAVAHHLGKTLMQQLQGGSPEAVDALIVSDFKALASKMSDEKLIALYRGFMDKPELMLASQGTVEVGYVALDEAPTDFEAERAFMSDFKHRIQPFKWGLDSYPMVFNTLKEVLVSRGRGDVVLSDENEKAITDQVAISPSTIQLLTECALREKPIDEVVEALRSSGGSAPFEPNHIRV